MRIQLARNDGNFGKNLPNPTQNPGRPRSINEDHKILTSRARDCARAITCDNHSYPSIHNTCSTSTTPHAISSLQSQLQVHFQQRVLAYTSLFWSLFPIRPYLLCGRKLCKITTGSNKTSVSRFWESHVLNSVLLLLPLLYLYMGKEIWAAYHG